MKFAMENEDGTMTDLLSVPNYSYAWQPTYELAEPVQIKAGTKVHVTGAFDNSEFNPAILLLFRSLFSDCRAGMRCLSVIGHTMQRHHLTKLWLR